MFGGCGKGRRTFYTFNGQQCVGDRDDLKREKSLESSIKCACPITANLLSKIPNTASVQVIGSTESFSVNYEIGKLDH